MRGWVGHIRLTDVFIAAERAADPTLVGMPVVIWSDGQIRAASLEASRSGINRGLSRAAVRQACPFSVWREFNQQRYQDWADRAWQIAVRHFPRVEPVGLDEAFLGAAAGERIVRDAAGRLLSELAAEIGIAAAVGLAANRLLARIASGPAGMNCRDQQGVALIAEGGGWLQRLPINELWPVPDKVRERLICLGLTTIGEVSGLPVGELTTMFGPAGRRLAELCRGQDRSTVKDDYPPRTIPIRRAFEGGLDDRSSIDEVLDDMGQGLARQLAAAMEGCCALCLAVEWEGGEWRGERRWDLPGSDGRTISGALRLLFAGALAAGRLGGPPTAITATASELVPIAWEQAELLGREQRDISRLVRTRQRAVVVPPPVGDRRERMLGLFDPVRGAYGR